MNIQSFEDWYHITVNDVIATEGGKALLNLYGGSLVKALRSVYPYYIWRVWNFKHLPFAYWDDFKHHRQLFDSIADELGINELNEWYKVKQKDIKKMADYVIHKYYQGSSIRAIQSIYPEYPWQLWKFSGYATSAMNASQEKHRALFDWNAEKLGIKVELNFIHLFTFHSFRN